MKRIITPAWLLVLVISVLAGYGISPGSLVAQRGDETVFSVTPAPLLSPGERTLWPNQPEDATHWSIDDIRKAHQTLADAEKAGKRVEPNTALHDFPYWTRSHSCFIRHVPEKATGNTAEQHLGYAQFVVVMGGTGTVMAGGQLQTPVTLAEGGQPIPGELRGRTITGGETFHLTEGDRVSIPPNTPTQFKAEAPGGLTYMVMKVNAMLYPWDLIR